MAPRRAGSRRSRLQAIACCAGWTLTLLAFPGISAAAPAQDLQATAEALGDVVDRVVEAPEGEPALSTVETTAASVAPAASKVVRRVGDATRRVDAREPVARVVESAVAAVDGSSAEGHGAAAGGPSDRPSTTPAKPAGSGPASGRDDGSGARGAHAANTDPLGGGYASAFPGGAGTPVTLPLAGNPTRGSTGGEAGGADAPVPGGGGQAPASGLASPASSGLSSGSSVAVLLGFFLMLPVLLGAPLSGLSAIWAPAVYLQPIERPG